MNPGEAIVRLSAQVAAPSRAVQLTDHFYAWEQRGRGWLLWPYVVAVEPPYEPFWVPTHQMPAVIDDGWRPSFLSRCLERLFGSTRPAINIRARALPREIESPPIEEEATEPLAVVRVVLPPDESVPSEAAEQFLLSLTPCWSPVSCELVGQPDRITMQVACQASDRHHVWPQLRAHFPDAVCTETVDPLGSSWTNGESQVVVADFGLSQEFMRPLRSVRRLDPDPLTGIVGALDDLEPGEQGVVQVIFLPARGPWTQSVLRSLTTWEGRPFFADAPDMLALARDKVARPLFGVVLRVAGLSPEHERAWEIVRHIGGALTVACANPSSNELIALTNDGYPDEEHLDDLVNRRTHRIGMLLNSAELLTLVHPPSASLRCDKLQRHAQRSKAAPAHSLGHRFILGDNVHRGVSQPVGQSQDQRLRHTHVIGASGTGKSTLLLNLIVQDLEQGNGIGVIDPHGDLIDQILGYVPEERLDDVILVDPGSPDQRIGFNILSAHSDLEKTLLSSDLVAVFRRLSTSWGDQMTSVLGNAILAFLESERGGTLVDLRRFLVEPEFRKEFLGSVQDDEVRYFWQREFSLLQGRPQAPLLTRLDAFLRPKLIRTMIGHDGTQLDIGAVMSEGKILLIKLAQGAIGEENAALLGALFVAKIHQLTLGRQEHAQEQRRPFFLYIDEFHSVMTPSMASLLSGARKYRLGLILAHQELRQLAKDSDVASAVLTNAATRICFRVGDADAERLEQGFSAFGRRDLQSLGMGEAIARLDGAEHDFTVRTRPLPLLNGRVAHQRRERLMVLADQRRGPASPLAAQRPVTSAPQALSLAVSSRQPAEPEPEAIPTVGRPGPSVPKEPRPGRTAPSPGRGGPQHKYLQELIKRWAQERGYKTTIEKSVLNRLGSVDVALERDGRCIACEISVTSTVDYELENVQKCLAAGFEHVVLVTPDAKAIATAFHAIDEQFPPEIAERVHVLMPEDVLVFLDQRTTQSPDQRVRGYKVKVSYDALSEEERTTRKRAIAHTILGALRRLK